MRNLFLILLFVTAPVSLLFSQVAHSQQNDSTGHTGRTAVYEIITSGIYTYNSETKHGAYGSEFHFTYWINHVWGAGLGYTIIYGEGKEYTHQIAILGSYNPTSWLTINTGPNFILPSAHHDLLVSGYLETEFNYRPQKWLHL